MFTYCSNLYSLEDPWLSKGETLIKPLKKCNHFFVEKINDAHIDLQKTSWKVIKLLTVFSIYPFLGLSALIGIAFKHKEMHKIEQHNQDMKRLFDSLTFYLQHGLGVTGDDSIKIIRFLPDYTNHDFQAQYGRTFLRVHYNYPAVPISQLNLSIELSRQEKQTFSTIKIVALRSGANQQRLHTFVNDLSSLVIYLRNFLSDYHQVVKNPNRHYHSNPIDDVDSDILDNTVTI